MEKVRVFTAFSGYDSQCLALKKLGINYDLVGWSEIDKHAIKAHNILFPQFKERNYGDISKIDWSQVPDFDLFTYSSPCQDFSLAGKQKGGEEGSGTRSSLLWECKKAILAKKPKYLLLENVDALVSKKFIELFNSWISELAEYGYVSYWSVLNSKDYGIPQNRNRVFLISIRKENTNDYPIYNFPKSFPLTVKLKDLLEKNVDKKYYLKEETVKKFLYISDDIKEIDCGVYGLSRNRDAKGNVIKRNFNPYVNCLHTQVGSARENMEVFVFEKDEISNSNTIDLAPRACAIRGRLVKGEENKFEQQLEINKNELSNALTTSQKYNYILEPIKIIEATKKGYAEAEEGDGVNISRMSCHTRRGRVGKGYAHTLTTSCDIGTVEKCEVQTEEGEFKYEYRIRKLTPRECFRLMGVNDNDIDKIINSDIPTGQFYKLAGNSIVVDVLEKIFNKLFLNRSNDFGHNALF